MLRQAELAHVDQRKITDYLLSFSHPDGRSKADFLGFGFRVEQWRVLADALLAVGVTNPAVAAVRSPYGIRFTVDGALPCPDGRAPQVRTVWISDLDGSGQRLITAHPLKAKS